MFQSLRRINIPLSPCTFRRLWNIWKSILVKPATSFTLLECMIIWCKFQVIKNLNLSNGFVLMPLLYYLAVTILTDMHTNTNDLYRSFALNNTHFLFYLIHIISSTIHIYNYWIINNFNNNNNIMIIKL